MITEDCNLDCKYCYVKKTKKVMSNEVIEKSLEFFKNNSNNSSFKIINITGGEPLIHIDKIKYILKVKEKFFAKKPVIIFLNTNGTLLNEKIMKILTSNLVGIRISMDGYGSGNKNRPTITGENSFNILEKKLNLFQKYKEYILIRLTISPDLSSDAYNNVKYIHELGFTTIEIKPEQGTIWSDKNINEFVDNMIKINAYAKKNKITLESYKSKKLFSLSKYSCIDPKQKIFVATNGDVYPCTLLANLSNEKEKNNTFLGNILTDNPMTYNPNVAKMGQCLICEFTNERCHPCRKTSGCMKYCMKYNIRTGKEDMEVAKTTFKLTREIDKRISKII